MDKMDHLMAEKNENNKDSQKGQVTSKKYFKKNNPQVNKEVEPESWQTILFATK
jgi:hypothetical protein